MGKVVHRAPWPCSVQLSLNKAHAGQGAARHKAGTRHKKDKHRDQYQKLANTAALPKAENESRHRKVTKLPPLQRTHMAAVGYLGSVRIVAE